MTAASLARELGRGFLDLLFAPVCLGCREPLPTPAPDRLVCATCWSRARELPHPRCERCWNPRPTTPLAPQEEDCPLCLTLPPSLRAVRSAFLHEEPVRSLLHALKYHGWRRVADPLGTRMATLDFPQEVEEEADLVVPVPISRARARQRGYNQAALLAARVAAGRPAATLLEVLERSRGTGSQTTLHPLERRANVATAFRVRAGLEQAIRGRHLLLVDDVWTTGATAVACCDTLTRAGARAVSVVTCARALPELRRLDDTAGRSLRPA